MCQHSGALTTNHDHTIDHCLITPMLMSEDVMSAKVCGETETETDVGCWKVCPRPAAANRRYYTWCSVRIAMQIQACTEFEKSLTGVFLKRSLSPLALPATSRSLSVARLLMALFSLSNCSTSSGNLSQNRVMLMHVGHTLQVYMSMLWGELLDQLGPQPGLWGLHMCTKLPCLDPAENFANVPQRTD